VVILFMLGALIFGAAWVAHVVDMVFSGRGLETMVMFWGGHMHYVSAFVLICAMGLAALVAVFLNVHEYLMWRDLQHKYGGGKPNPAMDGDTKLPPI
jgi:hypothetical protein